MTSPGGQANLWAVADDARLRALFLESLSDELRPTFEADETLEVRLPVSEVDYRFLGGAGSGAAVEFWVGGKPVAGRVVRVEGEIDIFENLLRSIGFR